MMKTSHVAVMALLLVALAASCVPAPEPVCESTTDLTARNRVIAALKPGVEFVRSDGSRYSMDSFLWLNELEILDCKTVYRVVISPKTDLPDGGQALGGSESHVIDKKTNAIVESTYEGE